MEYKEECISIAGFLQELNQLDIGLLKTPDLFRVVAKVQKLYHMLSYIPNPKFQEQVLFLSYKIYKERLEQELIKRDVSFLSSPIYEKEEKFNNMTQELSGIELMDLVALLEAVEEEAMDNGEYISTLKHIYVEIGVRASAHCLTN